MSLCVVHLGPLQWSLKTLPSELCCLKEGTKLCQTVRRWCKSLKLVFRNFLTFLFKELRGGVIRFSPSASYSYFVYITLPCIVRPSLAVVVFQQTCFETADMSFQLCSCSHVQFMSFEVLTCINGYDVEASDGSRKIFTYGPPSSTTNPRSSPSNSNRSISSRLAPYADRFHEAIED